MKRAIASLLSEGGRQRPPSGIVKYTTRWPTLPSASIASSEVWQKGCIRGLSSFSSNDTNSSPPPAPQPSKRKVSVVSLLAKKQKNQRISVVTAYDYPSALHVGQAGIDICLVGDSVGMVELGHETTQKVTLDMMIHHCLAASRGLSTAVQQGYRKCMLVGDMPFGTYEFQDTDIALRAAYRFVQEGNCDAVKLEGGTSARAKTVQRIVDGGIAVMGHVGLTPQAVSVIGGFRAQGRTADQAQVLLDDALRLQDAGCFSIVLECVPAHVAAAITDRLDIPTIGIGAGGGTSGQVLVYHDMMGILSSTFVPKFCKQYAQVGTIIQQGLETFKADVESSVFPGEEYSPYGMSEGEQEAFDRLLQKHDWHKKKELASSGGGTATLLDQPGQQEQRGQIRSATAIGVGTETRDSHRQMSQDVSSLSSNETFDESLDLYGGSGVESVLPALTEEDGSHNEQQRQA